MIAKRYSASFKIAMVEEFKKTDMSIAAFAAMKNIPDSTFNDWVLKYDRQGKGFGNITNEIIKLDDGVELVDPSPMRLYHSYLSEKFEKDNVRVYYNGAVIEFNKKLLDKVMKIVRSW